MKRHFDPKRDTWAPLTLDSLRPLIDQTPAWLSGGMAIDVWLGHHSRPHDDIDVSVLREDWPALANLLPTWLEPFSAHDGMLGSLGGFGVDPGVHTVWLLNLRTKEWALQVNLETGDGEGWAYRRNPSVRLAWPRTILNIDGMRVVAPEVQLLWKSRSPKPKDEQDRKLVMPLLSAASRLWLDEAVGMSHPTSPWNVTVR